MIENSLLLLVSGGGLFLGLFSTAQLLSPAKSRIRANRYLATITALCSINIAHAIWCVVWPESFPFRSSFLTEPMQFLMAPLIAAYLRVLVFPGFAIRARMLLHAIPFALITIFDMSPLSRIVGENIGLPLLTIGLWALLVAQTFSYLIPSLRILHRYRRALREEASNTAGIDLGWLIWFNLLIVALYLSYTALLAFLVHGPSDFPIRSILSIILCVFVIALGFLGLRQRELPALVVPLGIPEGGEAKYLRGAVSAERAQELKRGLERAMKVDRIFLDPELDLSMLATRVGAARNEISCVINRDLGKNFYDYINEYRVREVLRLMGEGRREKDKMIALAFDSGFNSKPTFNAVFKKTMGITPSEYREKSKKKSDPSL